MTEISTTESQSYDPNKPGQTNLPKPMVEIDKIEALAFAGGQKGGEQYLRSIWIKVLFWAGSIAGYIIGILSLIVNIVK